MEWTRIDRSAALLSTIIAILIVVGGCIEPIPTGPDPFCGDGSIDAGEQCDAGSANGATCTPGYGETCTYCSSSCEQVDVEGAYCGDGVCQSAESCVADCGRDVSYPVAVEVPAGTGLSIVSDADASEGSVAVVSSSSGVFDTGVENAGYVYVRMLGPSTSEDAFYVTIGSASLRRYPSQQGAYEWVETQSSDAGTVGLAAAELNARLDVVVISDSALSTAELDAFVDVDTEAPPEPPAPSTRTIIWSEDHESGTLDGWDPISISGSATADISTDYAHSGSYSAKGTVYDATSSGAGVRFTFKNKQNAAYDEPENLPNDAYYSVWLYIPQFIEGDNNIFQWKQEDRLSDGTYTMRKTMSITIRDMVPTLNSKVTTGSFTGVGVTLDTADRTLPVGEWFEIECRYVWRQTEDGLIDCTLDGEPLLRAQNTITEFSNMPWAHHPRSWAINNYAVGAQNPTTHSMYFDDAVVSVGTDASPSTSDLPVIEHDLSTRLMDITSCAGTRGNRPVLGGNVITPVASDPFSTDAIITYTTPDEHVISVTLDENGNCDYPIRINERTVPSAGSHDQPSVLIDGEGNREYFYYGGEVYSDFRWTESGPYARRMNVDGSLERERFARIWTPSETHGFRMNDGRIFVAGSDTNARINIIDKDGSYAWPYSRQVVDSDSAAPSEYECRGNRFTKAVFHQGDDNRLHATWGWGGGLGGDDPYAECPNMQHYRDDSMQVYYAFSEDDGVTWQNLERTRQVVATLCDDVLSTCNDLGGIAYNDEDFKVSDTRQRQHRKLWVDAESNVKLGFIKSKWCDSGICTARDVTDPGAIMLLEFNLNDADLDEVQETMVWPQSNYFFGAMQPGDGGLYFYAINEDTGYTATEYFYKDGETTVNPIKGCIRLQGEMRVPNQNIIRVLMECSGDERSVWLYERGVER